MCTYRYTLNLYLPWKSYTRLTTAVACSIGTSSVHYKGALVRRPESLDEPSEAKKTAVMSLCASQRLGAVVPSNAHLSREWVCLKPDLTGVRSHVKSLYLCVEALLHLMLGFLHLRLRPTQVARIWFDTSLDGKRTCRIPSPVCLCPVLFDGARKTLLVPVEDNGEYTCAFTMRIYITGIDDLFRPPRFLVPRSVRSKNSAVAT